MRRRIRKHLFLLLLVLTCMVSLGTVQVQAAKTTGTKGETKTVTNKEAETEAETKEEETKEAETETEVATTVEETKEAKTETAEETKAAETKAEESKAAETEAAAAQAGDMVILKLVTLPDGAEAKEKPQDSAKTVMTFEPNSSVAVVEEVNSSWYAIGYQGNIYYVKRAKAVDQELGYDQAALDKEFEQQQVESKLFIEEVERHQNELKQSRIWAGIIIVLVVAIIGVGVYVGIRAKKKDE